MNLLRACAKGDLAEIKKLVADGTEVNAADSSGRTPIIEAAWADHLDVVKFLVEKGAAVDSADNAGYTALMRACEEGHLQEVIFLLSQGASANARGKVRQTTPLMLAAEQGHLKVIDALLANGAKINAVDQFEDTAVARAYRMEQFKTAEYLESKGGRGKPERSSLGHYSSRDHGGSGKGTTKAVLPRWSAAANEGGMGDADAEGGAGEEMAEE